MSSNERSTHVLYRISSHSPHEHHARAWKSLPSCLPFPFPGTRVQTRHVAGSSRLLKLIVWLCARVCLGRATGNTHSWLARRRHQYCCTDVLVDMVRPSTIVYAVGCQSGSTLVWCSYMCPSNTLVVGSKIVGRLSWGRTLVG